MSAEKRNPYFKFYARDWRGDGALRLCSFASRGLWVDLLSIMHDEGEPYGHLKIAGCVLGASEIAVMVGRGSREIDGLIQELENKGIFSRTEDGTIYSRRMVRDKAKEELNKANGKLGGNPSLNMGVNPEDKTHIHTQFHNQNNGKEINLNSFRVGKNGNGAVTIKDETERLERFKKKLATAWGRGGWEIVRVASTPGEQNFPEALAACKKFAMERKLCKAWPYQWPA